MERTDLLHRSSHGQLRSTTPPEGLSDRRNLPAIVSLVALISWLTVAKVGALIDSDLWWHLAAGDWIRENGIPRTDPFSWTAADQPWQPNSWMADVVMSWVRDSFGLSAISIGRALVVPAVALAIWWWCRTNEASQVASVGTAAVLTVAVAPFIVERPAVLGMLLIVPALVLASKSPSTSRLVWIASTFALWANLHGSVVVGVAVVGLLALGAAIHQHRLSDLITPIVAFGATLLNPYGFAVYTHTLVVREASASIDEWQPLALSDSAGRIYALVILVVVGALALRRKRDDLALAFPTLALALGTIMSVRTAAIFLVVAAPLVALGVGWIADRLTIKRYEGRPHPVAVAAILGSLAVAALSSGTIADVGSVDRAFSADLVDAIPDDCRLLNEYTLGGFVIDRRYPQIAVSQDGRNDLYGAIEIQRQTDLVLGSSTAALAESGIDCVLLEDGRPLARSLELDPAWRQSADDHGTSLWLLDG